LKTAGWLPANLSLMRLLVTLVGLFVADGLVSKSLIERGLGYEGNPFLSGLSGPNLVLIKLASALLAALILWDIHKTRPRQAVVAAICSVVVYTGIVYWNLSIFLTV
jgi:hypothetical protein